MAKLISNWKNRVDQPDGTVNIDLVIVDEDGQIPMTTINKTFPSTIVNDRFLIVQADEEIKKLIVQYKSNLQKLAKLATLSDNDKDGILLKWAKSLPEDQKNQILLNGLN